MDIKDIIKKAIDFHVHVGPEIIPRKFNLNSLIKAELGNLAGFAIKNHFFPTVPEDSLDLYKNRKPRVMHSVSLNNYVGGFNPYVIRAVAEIAQTPIVVWFPTIHAGNFLLKQKHEIADEWIDPKFKKKIGRRTIKGIKALTVWDSNRRLKPEVIEVLREIRNQKAILATGHISWRESDKLIRYAIKNIGIKKIIVTHPIYQRIDMPIRVQKELAKLGALMEQSFSMHSMDGISIKKIAGRIKEIGARNCIMTSDVGQTFSPKPSEALGIFAKELFKEGIALKDLEIMLVKNPLRLLG